MVFWLRHASYAQRNTSYAIRNTQLAQLIHKEIHEKLGIFHARRVGIST